jgi:hypothetical protein
VGSEEGKLIKTSLVFLDRVTRKFVRPVTSLLRPGAVAMFHIGRCGSTVLADLLRQNKKICWDGEIYQAHCNWLESKGIILAPNSLREQSPFELLQRHMRFSGARYYGFEIKFYNLRCYGIETQVFVDEIEKLGIERFILLERRNYLRKIVSSVVAEKAGKYHLRIGSNPEFVRVKIEVDELDLDYDRKSLLDHLRGFRDDVLNFQRIMNGRGFLKLTYEDDIMQDPVKTSIQVCEFLGISPAPAVIRYTRSTPFPLRDVVANFREVETALAGTEFAWMLND